MIRKVVSINNVGKFKKCAPIGDVAFHRLTIIYAENGRGKTTLSAILRSLQTGDGVYILERHALGSSDNEFPYVHLLLHASANAKFVEGGWSQTLPSLEIFDSAFVNDNVFSGDYVDHDHKKNLYRFVVGEQGIQLVKRLDTLDDAIRAKNTELKDCELQIQQHMRHPIPIQKFISLPIIANVDDRITECEHKIETLKRAEAIQKTPLLQELTLPTVPIEALATLLSKGLADVSADAERKTRHHISYCMDNHGEAWVKSGLRYVRDQRCPFCGQALVNNELLSAYQDYFNAAYSALKAAISSFGDELRELLSEKEVVRVKDIIASNEALTTFWQTYVPADYPSICFCHVHEIWQTLRTTLETSIAQKAGTPLEAIAVDSSTGSPIQSYKELTATTAAYNTRVGRVNDLISEMKKKTQATDLPAAQVELQRLDNTKARYQTDVVGVCDEHKKLTEDKRQLEIDKKQARFQLDEYTASTFRQYELGINRYLEMFGAGFRIVETKTSYTGGKPSSNYRIMINGCTVDLGNEGTSGERCFKTTLSDGDRNALAFAFFLARMDQDPDIANKVVLFDDPITSLDIHRKTCTKQHIIRIVDRAKQVIVLSHDANFLRLIWDDARKIETKTLHISEGGVGSSIREWDIATETRADYFKNYETLRKYLDTGCCDDHRAVARCIRPLLEGNLRVRFPQHFPQNEWLGELIKRVRNASPHDALASLQEHVPDLSDINDYSKRYHHSENPYADTEPINDTELKAFARRTLSLVNR